MSISRAWPWRLAGAFLGFVIVTSYRCNGMSSYTRTLTKVISTKYGVVRGLVTQFATEMRPQLQPVESYLGIPYAASPTGNLRFMPPTTPAQFEGGVRNATKFGPVCPQNSPNVTQLQAEASLPRTRIDYLKRLDGYLRNQSEDCLYLNIYVPSSSREEKAPLPVLVYVHGESYSWGSGNPYDGTILASYANIIVVTLNYRLGVFGFLSTGDGNARGNYGLMDQVAAVKFVEENIEQFGGDPNNITLMGQGVGAACVNLLMISPVAANTKKLFQRAILLSGSALSPWAISHDPKKYTMELARSVKCHSTGDVNNVDLIRCLKSKSFQELLKVPIQVPQFLTGFGPAVDGVFIPNQPWIIMRNYAGLYRKYGLLIGLTRHEAVNLLTKQDLLHGLDEQRQNRLLRTFVRNLFTYHLGEVFMSIKFEYAEWEKSSRLPSNLRDATLDMLGDALTVAPLLEAAQLHAGVMAQETYMYLFQHTHRMGHVESDDYPATLESVHSDDLPFIFGACLLQNTRLSPWPGNCSAQDAYVSEVTANFIANFVRYGDPKKLPRTQNVPLSDAVRQAVTQSNWPKYDAERQKYLQISARSKEVRDHYRAHKTAFWNDLIPKLNFGDPESSSGLARDHHNLADFEKLDSYDGMVRSLAFLALPPPPLPPSTTPPPWRNKTRIRASTSLATVPTQTNDVVVTPVDPEPQYNVPQHAALFITVAVGCTLLLVNVLVCGGIYYQKSKMRKKYLMTRTPIEKRNGTALSSASDKLVENDHAETLLPPPSVDHGGAYSMPGTPMPISHYGQGHGERERPTRTFNTFSDQHRQLPGSANGSETVSMPPSLPVPTILRAMPHLQASQLGEHGVVRRPSDNTLRKTVSSSSNQSKMQETTETDETAV